MAMFNSKDMLSLPDTGMGTYEHEDEDEDEEEEEEVEELDTTTSSTTAPSLPPPVVVTPVDDNKENTCVEDDGKHAAILTRRGNEHLQEILYANSPTNLAAQIPVTRDVEHAHRFRHKIITCNLGSNYEDYSRAVLTDRHPSLELILDADQLHGCFVSCKQHEHEKLILDMQIESMEVDNFPRNNTYVLQLESRERAFIGDSELKTKKWIHSEVIEHIFQGSGKEPVEVQGLSWVGASASFPQRQTVYHPRPLTALNQLDWYRTIIKRFHGCSFVRPDDHTFRYIPYPTESVFPNLLSFYISQHEKEIFGDEDRDAHSALYNQDWYFRLTHEDYNKMLERICVEYTTNHDILHSARLNGEKSGKWRLTVTPQDREAFNREIKKRASISNWKDSPLYLNLQLGVSMVVL